MKKIIALILIALMCILLTSCTDYSEIDLLYARINDLEKEVEELKTSDSSSTNSDVDPSQLIGTWFFGESNTITFNEDKTFTFISKTENLTGRWAASSELSMFFLSGDVTSSGYYEKVDGVLKIILEGHVGVKQ
ncbi:MAG: hypothetical protein IKL40_05320 [Clostridia bacterium]|nr:hypothetical protein [Clostridia bacterium]